MFTYGDADAGDYTGHIVGGDAYNYIIIGVRGVGLIGVGVVSALIGTGLLITHAVVNAKHEIIFESSRHKQAIYNMIESKEKNNSTIIT